MNLDWIINNLNRFTPIQGKKIDHFKIKALAELSMAYSYLQGWKLAELDKYVDILKVYLSDQLNDYHFAQMPRRDPLHAYNYLFPYLMLRTNGQHFPYYEETLKQVQKWMPPLTVEAVPYRKLEQEFMFWKAECYDEEPDWDSLSKKTILGYMPSPLYLEEERTYAITHTLFYLTDLGNKPLELSYIDENKLISLIEYLLIHYLRIGNWDIVGELLININSLKKCNSYIYKHAAKEFESAWLDNGSIPPKRILNIECLQKSEEEKFKDRYHTTLVGILYCSTYLSNKPEGNRDASVI
ncbi:DUF6895 family protein [Bacillus bombysepticus]